MNGGQSLLFNSNPVIRTTYRAHLWLYALGAPFIAMIQYSPNLAVRTFNAHDWVPFLAAIVPASHFLAIFFTSIIGRGDKTRWVVVPMIISNLMFFLLFLVNRQVGWTFAVVVILGYALRAPIILAQSSIFRTNYPPTLRSFALSVPLAFQYAGVSLYAFISGRLFDKSEDWVIPMFILSAVMGIAGAWLFRGVRQEQPASLPISETSGREGAPAPRLIDVLKELGGQFRVLRTNTGFFRFQLAYLFFGSGFVAIQAVMPFYLKAEFNNLHEQDTMAINTVPALAIAITLPFWGKLLDRHNPLLIRTIVNGIWSLTPIFLYFAKTMKGVYIGQMIQGFAWSGSTLVWWLGVNYYARAHEVANLMSVHQTLTGVRGIITPFFGIWIGNAFGYKRSMLFWFVLMLVGFFIMLEEVMRERRMGRLRTSSEAEATLDQAPLPEPDQSPADLG